MEDLKNRIKRCTTLERLDMLHSIMRRSISIQLRHEYIELINRQELYILDKNLTDHCQPKYQNLIFLGYIFNSCIIESTTHIVLSGAYRACLYDLTKITFLKHQTLFYFAQHNENSQQLILIIFMKMHLQNFLCQNSNLWHKNANFW